jgi:hypothetical protein
MSEKLAMERYKGCYGVPDMGNVVEGGHLGMPVFWPTPSVHLLYLIENVNIHKVKNWAWSSVPGVKSDLR